MGFMNSLGSGITIMVAIPFVIVALFLLVMGIRGRRLTAASQNWPSTTGRVLASDVEARRSSRSSGGTSTSYYAVVFYEYQVSGQIYRSNKLQLDGEIGGGLSRAQQKVMQYPAGSGVTVYYNPDNPQQAGLERGSGRSNVLIGVALLIIVILLCTVGFTAGMMGSVSQMISGIVR